MKKRSKIALLGVLVYLASSIGFVHAESSVEKRIADAQEKFNAVLAQNPQKVVNASVFFTNDLTLEQAKNALAGEPLSVKGFRHGTQSYSGGYTLRQGETLDQASNDYARDHLFFLKQRKQMEEEVLRTETDPGLLEAISVHLKEAEQMEADFEEHGLRIIGMDISGHAADLQSFKDKNLFARVIELKETGRPQPAILPQQLDGEEVK